MYYIPKYYKIDNIYLKIHIYKPYILFIKKYNKFYFKNIYYL